MAKAAPTASAKATAKKSPAKKTPVKKKAAPKAAEPEDNVVAEAVVPVTALKRLPAQRPRPLKAGTPKKSWTGQTTPFACIFAKWAQLSFSRAKARLPLQSALRLAGIP